VKIKLRNPSREVELPGRKRVKDVLRELDILPGTVLVIRGADLLTADEVVGDGDELEVRPVMSGGSDTASESKTTSVSKTTSESKTK
jgi:sulfur carrier protein